MNINQCSPGKEDEYISSVKLCSLLNIQDLQVSKHLYGPLNGFKVLMGFGNPDLTKSPVTVTNTHPSCSSSVSL